MIPKSYRVADKLARPVFPPTWTNTDEPPEFTGIKADKWEVPTILATIVVCGSLSLSLWIFG